MTGNETERALACSSQWAGIYFQNGFFILFLLLPLSINIAIIIISYFLKIMELWGNSQKRNKANKMEKGRTLPERLTQWCGSGQSCWVWAEKPHLETQGVQTGRKLTRHNATLSRY